MAKKRGRPYVHFLSTLILRYIMLRIRFRIDSNNALHIFLIMGCLYNHKLALDCGLVSIPSSECTFYRRLKTISTIDVKERTSTMGYLFVTDCLAMADDHSITAVDSTLMKAKDSVRHKSSMEKGEVPCTVLILIPDGEDTAIPTREGIWIQITSNVYNRRDRSTSNYSGCNYC
jgi:hypothetical protein